MGMDALEKNTIDGTKVEGIPTVVVDVAKEIPWKEVGKYTLKLVDYWLEDHDLPEKIPVSKAQIQKWLKFMYAGMGNSGEKVLGLKDVSDWKLSEQMPVKDLKQHAAVSAEIIGVTKENIVAACTESDIKAVRTADLSDEYQMGDVAYNKVRLDGNGDVVSRVRTKYVGKNGQACLKKLVSKKEDAVLTTSKMDKIEIPKDYYDDIKNNNRIGTALESFRTQLAKVKELGKEDAVKTLETLISRYTEVDTMLERSTVSSNEALYATVFPERYVAKITAEEVIKDSTAEGLKPGMAEKGLDICKTAIEQIGKKFETTPGLDSVDISGEEAIATVVEALPDAPFISREIAAAFEGSNHELINSLKEMGLPEELVVYASLAFDTVMDYATGVIDKEELMNAMAKVVAKVGAEKLVCVIASALGITAIAEAGPVAALTLSLVSGIVISELTTLSVETYEKYGPDIANELTKKAKETANNLIDKAEKYKTGAGEFMKNKLAWFNKDKKIANAV